MNQQYDNNYPKSKIGKDNPYYQCAHCLKSDPEINNQVKNHRENCYYRKLKEGTLNYE